MQLFSPLVMSTYNSTSMAPYGCFLCGDFVEIPGARSTSLMDPPREPGRKSWASQFRTIITTPGVRDPALSGVGCVIGDRRYFRPLHYDVRWSNRSYAFPDSDELMSGRYYLPELILHSHCCVLLEQFFHPKPIPLHRLVEVCNTFPSLQRNYETMLIWGPGHDYGGVLGLTHLYPWREALGYARRWCEQIRSHPPDPLRIPKLKSYVQHSRLHSPIKHRKKGSKRSSAKKKPSKVFRWRGGVSNAFTKLPLEILEYILVRTPTDGVRSLSKASKGLRRIIPSSLGQSFWASRLEYSWAFEPQGCGDALDWRSLYFAMNKAPSECLLNRRRICGLVESLARLLCLRWSGNSTLLPLDEKEKTIQWKEVHGLLRKHSDHLSRTRILEEVGEGCRQSFSQSTSIPTLLQRVGVSIIEIGDATYITGLRLAPKNGPEICLGYTKGTERSLEITGIHGFIVAVGSDGIRALQFISPERQSSEWFGDPDGVPKTRRLAVYTPVTSLKAGFDAFKMVSIAVEDQGPCTPTGRLKKGVSLRDSALWFPDIPPRHLRLNDAYFKGRVSAASGFRPLCAVFGDANNPRPLTKVSLVEEVAKVEAIECQWDTGDVQNLGDVQRFCAGRNYNGTPYRLIWSTDGGRTATIRFKIDTHHPDHYHRHMPRHPALTIPMNIGITSTLTGLYAMWDNDRLDAIGPISQAIVGLSPAPLNGRVRNAMLDIN